MQKTCRKLAWACLNLAISFGLSGFLSSSLAAVRIQTGQLAPSHPTLLSLRLLPENPALWGVEASQRFLVLGKYSDGLERDLTTRSRFSIASPAIAKVDEEGRVVALAEGQTILGAEMEGHQVKTQIRVEGLGEKKPFSFAREIGGIFTKHGCNTSDCHGSVKGKAGFKLSMNALYPRDDYRWIVEGGVYQVLSTESGGPKVPRIDLKEPEKSLLLLKATFSASHGGGQRFTEDSADYQAILNWVRDGAPYGEESGEESVQVKRIGVLPQEVALDRQGSHQLLVTAHLSNGRREDITDQVLYVSNNPEVVEVSPQGLVKAVKTGETAIMIRAAGYAVSATFGVIAEPIPDYPQVPPNNLVDEYVFAKLRKFNIVPSELSSDAEFLRRVCLDVTGTLPPPQQVRKFLASKDPEKRNNLIEILLSTPEYVDYWTFRLGDFLRVGGGQFGGKPYEEWLRTFVAENKPYDQLARERVAAQGTYGPGWHYRSLPLRPRQNMMSEQARVFLGVRLDCAQCHNHPFETWSQNQFWGLTAFFGRVSQLYAELKGMSFYHTYEDPEGHGKLGEGGKILHPRTRKEVRPAFLDGTVLPEDQRTDMRQALAKWMTAPENPYFSQALVNRMWGLFFSRGIVEPVDDFRSTNPPTHPHLLKALAQDFIKHGYDLKHLIRLIVQSRTYQLSSTPNHTNRDDRINYSRALPRALDAEVLLDAISEVTGVEETFRVRAVNLLKPGGSQFLTVYGKPNRLTVPERSMKPNLPQALHQLAGTTYSDKLSKEGSRLDRLIRGDASDARVIEELYLAALTRLPTEEEKAGLEKMILTRPSRREALEDLLWGIVTSNEFSYNH